MHADKYPRLLKTITRSFVAEYGLNEAEARRQAIQYINEVEEARQPDKARELVRQLREHRHRPSHN